MFLATILANTIFLSASPESAFLAAYYHEEYRPQFHFTPLRNWTNDPNGLVYYKGEYHLFFQHNPISTDWGNMSWGHAISKDLVHWKELPIALFPDKNGTCFSGSAIVDWNNASGLQQGKDPVLIALYTGAPVPEDPKGPKFTQCLAYSNDCGYTWKKYEKNPVLPNIIGSNRDPKVIWHESSKQFVMALYLDKNDFALFGSKNLTEWKKLCDMPIPITTECPDFFEMPVEGSTNETRWVFTGADFGYMIGTFDGKTFKPETERFRNEFGANYYAAQTYSDIPAKDGRRIQIAWMNGGKYPGMPFNQQMSFPSELTLKRFPEGICLCRMPVREIKKLREASTSWRNKSIEGASTIKPKVDCVEIRTEIEPGSATEFGFRVHGQEIKINVANKKMTCLGKEAPVEFESGRLKLVILVDRTSIEIFANDGKVTMSSCYLPEKGKDSLEAFATGSAKFVSLTAYPLRSAWK